jgi:hypothetical protein
MVDKVVVETSMKELEDILRESSHDDLILIKPITFQNHSVQSPQILTSVRGGEVLSSDTLQGSTPLQ